MKLTVISLDHVAEEGFDAGPLEDFCQAHEVRSWVGHFFIAGGKVAGVYRGARLGARAL